MSLATRAARPPGIEGDREGRRAGRERDASRSAVFLCLVAIAALSTLIRALIGMQVAAPTVFSDELVYTKLADSIARTGQLALFNERGLSYSPLYPALLSPIYALGASAPTAYSVIKIVNALLISLSVFPTYKIARFVLARRLSLLVAGLSALVPAMLLSSFTMSENLAYPLCLTTVWALLAAIRAPGLAADAVLLVAIVAAIAARLQLVVLFPAALTAAALAALLGRDRGETVISALRRSGREHGLLWAVVAAALVVAGAFALAGGDVLSILGSYSTVGRQGAPNLWRFLDVLVRHVAGLEFAVAVVPFVAALVAAVVFFGRVRPREHVAFAAVALAMTSWFLVEVATEAALFEGPHGDIERIHERFLIYLVPFFLVSLIAACHVSGSVPVRVYLAAVAIAALFPVVIPFGTVVNQTIAFESPGLHPLARLVHGRLTPVPHTTVVAVFVAATLGLIYVRVRRWMHLVVALALLPLVLIAALGSLRIVSASSSARLRLPTHADWVDRAHPAGEVILVTGTGSNVPELETAYNNLSITRLYFLCRAAVGPSFGERQVVPNPSGRLRSATGDVNAAYVVAPVELGIRGRVVARNVDGGEVLVAPQDGRVTIGPTNRNRGRLTCSKDSGAA